MKTSTTQSPTASDWVLPSAGQSIENVDAEIVQPESALAWLDQQGANAAEWCTSSAWARAADVVLGAGSVRFVGFRVRCAEPLVATSSLATGSDLGNFDAICALTHDRANWRSGSPGRDEMRWPMDALGYQYAPVARPSLGDEQLGALRTWWLAAARRLFPDHRFHLQRTAPAWTESLHEAQGTSSPWSQANSGAPSWRGTDARDLESLRATLDRKHRKDLDYYYRRIGREGCRWRDYEASDQTTLQAAFDAVTTLHRSRLSAKGLSSRQLRQSACLEPVGQRFLAELASHNRPNLRLSLLWQGPHPIGGCLGFAFGSDYVAMMSGQDTNAAHGLDLGRQVLWHQIQAQANRQPTRIDLLGGDLDYKREFGLTPDATVDFECEPSRAAAWRRRAAVRLISTLRGLRPRGRRRPTASIEQDSTRSVQPESQVK